jgi:hypothetical protein
MRQLFETGKMKMIEMNGHYITMKDKCFVVRQQTTNFLVLESSSTQSYEWVRNYVMSL